MFSESCRDDNIANPLVKTTRNNSTVSDANIAPSSPDKSKTKVDTADRNIIFQRLESLIEKIHLEMGQKKRKPCRAVPSAQNGTAEADLASVARSWLA